MLMMSNLDNSLLKKSSSHKEAKMIIYCEDRVGLRSYERG